MIVRRIAGRSATVAALLLFCVAAPARADFIDWWLTADQQGRVAYERGEFDRAAQLFMDPLWKAMAYYASGDFSSAAAWFAQEDSPFGYFYLGNALAHAGRLPEAIDAYRRALTLEPDLAEAKFNLDWVEGLAALDEIEYEDAGGTGGKLGADGFEFSDRADNAKQTMTAEEAVSQGLTDEQIEEIWMRRVQTSPAEFLGLKFSYQLQAEP
jgi:Ca-activated chloride channel family protein